MKVVCPLVLVGIVVVCAGCGGEVVDTGAQTAAGLSYEEQILYAVNAGDVTAVQGYLDSSPDLITAFDSTGNTLLHQAATAGQVEVARLLIERGADVNALNAAGKTPLSALSGRRGNPDMEDFLSENGGVE